jgi:hypothetical protein
VKVIVGDIWELHSKGGTIVIPTNGCRRGDGSAIMGKGLALAAATRFPKLPDKLGKELENSGNHVYYFGEERIVTFPTKEDWHDKSNVKLIRRSAAELKILMLLLLHMEVVLPLVGCGAGGLAWREVEPVLDHMLGDQRAVVCTLDLKEVSYVR